MHIDARWLLPTAVATSGMYLAVSEIRAIAEARQSLGWPHVPGHVRAAGPLEQPHERGAPPFQRVRYVYTVAGIDYESNRVSFGRSPRERVVSGAEVVGYSENERVTVYYDPKDPESAVLEPGPTTAGWIAIAAGVGLVVFAGWIGRALT